MSITLEGFNSLDTVLKLLPIKVQKKVVRQATKAAAKNTLGVVKSNALSMIGGDMGTLIAKNAKVFVFKHQRRGSWGVQIGMDPREDKFIHYSASGKRSYIPSALEYGHGKARPRPFIRSAWDQTRRQAINIMSRELRTGIEREARKQHGA
jgi:HK97 gp10 family phage protein